MASAPKICGKDHLYIPKTLCPDPDAYFVGIVDATVSQGTDFDLYDGVKAYITGTTVEIPFTVTPSEFDPCEVGEQTFAYEAEGALTVTRTITVTAVANPTITGTTETITAQPGVEFDPLDGVTAEDAYGNPLTVTVTLDDGNYLLTENNVIITDENNNPIEADS